MVGQILATIESALEGRAVTCVRPLQVSRDDVLPVFHREARNIGVVIDTVSESNRLRGASRLAIHLLRTRVTRGRQRVLLLDNISGTRFGRLSRWLPSARITLVVEPDPVKVRLDLLRSINDFRQSHSLGELRLSKELTYAAERHCLDLAQRDHLSHTGSDGTSPLNRAYIQACRYREVYETTVEGCIEAEAIVGHWAASGNHRPILLTPNLHEVGISIPRPNALRAPVLVAVYGGGAPRSGIRRFNSHCLRWLCQR